MFTRLKKHFKKLPKNNEPYVLKGMYEIVYKIYPHSALDYHIVKHGIIQDWIATRLNQLINNDGVIFDIGANVGLLTLPFAKKHVTNGFVYAFEPDQENFKQLKNNIKLNSLYNVYAHEIVIQDDSAIKKITFFKRRSVDGDKLTNNGLSSIEKMPIHTISESIVPCSTIDLIVSQNDLSRIDFIKIDVEGSEYRVLNGGIKTIEKFKPIIMYEYSIIIDKLSKSENTLKSFNLLKELGYKQYKIFEEKFLIELDKYEPNLESTNVLAFHKSKTPEKLSTFVKN